MTYRAARGDKIVLRLVIRIAGLLRSGSPSQEGCTCRASLLATIRMSAPSSRASTAAWMREHASSRLTTCLSRTCPQLFGATWSSIKMPALVDLP